MSEISMAIWTAPPLLERRTLGTVVVGLAAAGFIVVLGSLAWACLPFHGKVSVYPVNPGGQPTMGQSAHNERPVTVHGGVGQIADDGETRGGMIWCDDSGGFAEGEPYRAGAIRPSANSPDLMVVVDRMSGCVDDESRALPMGNYYVSIRPAVYGDDGSNPDFDKNAIVSNFLDQSQSDSIDTCFYSASPFSSPSPSSGPVGPAAHDGNAPRPTDYIHPEPLVVGPHGGSLVIDDINMAPSASLGFPNVAGLCIREWNHEHARVNEVPIEILGPQRGHGHGQGRRPNR